jgi:nicotinamidase-related amidase
MIEFQNEFCKEGGKLYEAVKDEIERVNTIENAVKLRDEARKKGCMIVLCPFILDQDRAHLWKPDGLLKGVVEGEMFIRGSWGAEIIDELKSTNGEVTVTGKSTLCGFEGTNLEALLKAGGIRHVIVCGFLTNGCVESTCRTGYDKGYRMVVAADACATTSQMGHDHAKDNMFPMFGTPSTVDEVLAEIE